MFRKRAKKIYPPGTFIPFAARVLAIIQLCVAFTAILWNAGEPFMGRLFTVKSHLLLHEYALGQKDNFLQLPDETQEQILREYETAKKALEAPFSEKIQESARILLFDLHPYERGWILLSIIVPILLLKKVEGAEYALWILPLLAGVYGIDNRLNGKPPAMAEARLFPSEAYLVSTYLKEPLSQDILKQHEQLRHAWEQYLTAEWKSEYFFQVARIEKISQDSKADKWRQKQPAPLLYLYFTWNLFLVVGVTWLNRRESLQSNPKAQEG